MASRTRHSKINNSECLRLGFQIQNKILTTSKQQALSSTNLNEEGILVKQNQWADEEEKKRE
jgi:hypothetical protein